MTIALLLGLEPAPPRPTAAPVRSVRLLTTPRQRLPDLPKVCTTDPRLLRAQEERDVIYALLVMGGTYTRTQIAAETGIDEGRVSERLAVLREMGRAEYERQGRQAVWSAVEGDEEDHP